MKGRRIKRKGRKGRREGVRGEGRRMDGVRKGEGREDVMESEDRVKR